MKWKEIIQTLILLAIFFALVFVGLQIQKLNDILDHYYWMFLNKM